MRIAQFADYPLGIKTATMTESLELAPGRIQRITAAGKSQRRQLGGNRAVLASAADVQRFGHGPEIHADT